MNSKKDTICPVSPDFTGFATHDPCNYTYTLQKTREDGCGQKDSNLIWHRVDRILNQARWCEWQLAPMRQQEISSIHKSGIFLGVT